MHEPKGEETIFAEALRLSPEERAAYLAQVTAGDAELRQRIERLVGSYEAGDFLEQAAASGMRPTIGISVPLTEKAGDRIGHYKLLEQIGEGGCGVVYVAEQTEPVRRRVALKIVKLGMDTRSVIARFEAERQALALMDHPNIAKVFDAGATEAGRPYFVMELVRGMKITEYCDEKKLSTRARLDLFVQVCQAIQHAHQKGIIHRDIKPSNILVTVNDGVPVPKVIDFGIAKATSGQQLTDKTIYTAFEQFIGTPAYMSPEQAVLTSLDIDTRSDIYALGVLLYELLTGRTPFDAQELLAIGLDEMRRTIREQEPPRPSTRLSTLPGQELSTTAQRRGLDAPKLVSELRGDLDWIVMKALEKDRARRYETANGLAADIQRHLNNEPVVACPPSRIYRLQKAIQRNKLAFSATASVVAALAIGLAISTWRFAKEREALKRAVAAEEAAKEEKDSAEAVLKFVREKILAAGRPEGEEGGAGKDVTLREAIDRAESNISKAFTNRPLVEAAIRKTLGESYLYDLGEPILAIPQLERAVALRREGLGLANEHTLTTMSSLARAYDAAGKYEQAISLDAETLKWERATLGPNHRYTLLSMANLAAAYSSADKFDEAMQLAEEALKLSTAALKPDDKITLQSMTVLANCYLETGKLDEATSLYQKILELQKAKLRPDDPSILWSMHNLAVAYGRSGKDDLSLALTQETLKLRTAKLGPDHPDTLAALVNLAVSYYVAGKFDLGLPLNEQALKRQEAKLGPDHPDTLNSMNSLADGYRGAGKLDRAVPLYQKTLDLRKTRLGPDHSSTLLTMDRLAAAYQHAGNLELALSLYDELAKLQEAKLGSSHRGTLDTKHHLAVVCINAGRFERGVVLLKEVLKLRRAHDGPDHPNTMNDLAWAYETARNFDQAIQVREEIFKLQRAKGANHTDTLRAGFRLGQTLLEAAEFHARGSRQREDLANQSDRLLRDYLVGVHGHYTNNPVKLAERVYDVAELRYRQANFAAAEPLYREIVELRRAALGAEHKDTLDGTASMARLLTDWCWAERGAKFEFLNAKSKISERALEAERLLRAVLALRFRDSTNSWRIGDLKSRLGGALISVAVTDSALNAESREEKLAEAESLLLESHEQVKKRSSDKKYIRDSFRRLVRLYEAWEKPNKLAEWQQKLERFDELEEKSFASEPLIESTAETRAKGK